jgi:transcriptional regulator with XRE-family HTH domain
MTMSDEATNDQGTPDPQERPESSAPRGTPEEIEQLRLGARLKESREYLGLSQQLVADRTGIPRSAISDVERGMRKVDSLELKKFALVYGKPVGYFLDEAENPDPATHTLQVLTRATAGLTEADQQKLVDYAELLTTARARSRPSS